MNARRSAAADGGRLGDARRRLQEELAADDDGRHCRRETWRAAVVQKGARRPHGRGSGGDARRAVKRDQHHGVRTDYLQRLGMGGLGVDERHGAETGTGDIKRNRLRALYRISARRASHASNADDSDGQSETQLPHVLTSLRRFPEAGRTCYTPAKLRRSHRCPATATRGTFRRPPTADGQTRPWWRASCDWHGPGAALNLTVCEAKGVGMPTASGIPHVRYVCAAQAVRLAARVSGPCAERQGDNGQ
jgi:hypothetical protein